MQQSRNNQIKYQGFPTIFAARKRHQHMKTFLKLGFGLAILGVAGCNNAATDTAATAPAKPGQLTIAVIPKGTTHVYWKSVEAGANKAAKELGVNINYKGPLKESDRAGQIQIVQQFTSDGVDAIVLAPLDDVALVAPVKAATTKKIPVIIIDSALKGATAPTDFVATISTDNYKGGQLAGERLAKELGDKGKVVLLRYQEGSASTMEREQGFEDAIKKFPNIKIIVDNRYSGATMGDAKDAALNMADKLKEADGIFAPNESSASGMLLALVQLGIAGQKKFVGFDASPQLLEGLNKGQIQALVVQNPTKMGYDGVKAAVAAIKGEKVAPKQDTGVAVVDKANQNTPEMKEILGTK